MWGKRLHRVLYLNIGLYWDFWDMGGREQGDWDLGPDEGAIRLFRVAVVGNILPTLTNVVILQVIELRKLLILPAVNIQFTCVFD